MPKINFVYHIAEGEKLNIYINEDLLSDNLNEIGVENNFKLKIEQFRIHSKKNSAARDIGSFLVSPVVKSERLDDNLTTSERPYYAYFEADYEFFTDTEITITQYKKGYHSTYDVSSPSVIFSNVTNTEKINEVTYRNWVISKLFISLVMSIIPIFMIVTLVNETIANDLSIYISGVSVLFLILFIGMFWYSTF